MEYVILGGIVVMLAGATYWIFREEANDYDEAEENFRQNLNNHWHNKRKDD